MLNPIKNRINHNTFDKQEIALRTLYNVAKLKKLIYKEPTVLQAYRKHVEERAAENLPPLALDAQQVAELVELIKNPGSEDIQALLDLLIHRVPPGVDQAAYVKAAFLSAVASGEITCSSISREYAVELLGTMLGGYNIQSLIASLDDEVTAPAAVKALSHTLLIYDAFHDVSEKSKTNDYAKQVIRSWADAEWFTSKPEMAEEITVTVYKVRQKPGVVQIFHYMRNRCWFPRWKIL